MTVQAEPKNPDFRVNDRWRFLYETLCRRGKIAQDNEYWIFEKYTQLYSFAAALGFNVGKKNEVKTSYTPFTLNEIKEDPEWPTLRAIAWKASDCNTETILDYRKTIKLCDELADGGMQYLFDEFFAAHVKDNFLLRPKHIDIEGALSLIVMGTRRQAF
ncbi:MAG: hypothetical protein K2W82_09465 [Candidatus Obscuribacterales bacterium]|nr:hypothetical protein [Candidatus Obscuribacterales bacterium]